MSTSAKLRLSPISLLPRSPDRESLEFLPAALEIIETPPSPVGRATGISIAAAAILAIGWASVGQVDIIATAPGQIVPVGHSKTVQSTDTAVVSAIDVEDGTHVLSGDPLVELDSTQTEADRDRYKHDLLQAELDRARLRGLRQAWLNLVGPVLVEPPADAITAQLEATTAAMQAQFAEQTAKLAALDEQVVEKQAQGDEAMATLAKLQASLPWSEQLADLRRQLKDMQFGNKLAWIEAEQRAIELRHDLSVEVTRQAAAAAAKSALERQRIQIVAAYQKSVLTDLAKAEEQANQARQEYVKAAERTQLLTLRAPIDGKVQQLAVHTVGGVVTPAQPIMVVVPDNPGLIVEARVENKDVGFVRAGLPAEVKVEAFTFTRYGLIHGTVIDVSGDAATASNSSQFHNNSRTDDTGKDVEYHSDSSGYIAHVALAQTSVKTEGGVVPLSPGMAVTVEVKTGRRSVISYLLSPLKRYVHDGLRER